MTSDERRNSDKNISNSADRHKSAATTSKYGLFSADATADRGVGKLPDASRRQTTLDRVFNEQ